MIQDEGGKTTPDQQAEYVGLITKHQSPLYAYILTIHPDRNAAEDILQEANMVLWRRMDDFEHGTNFQAWAFRIAYFQTMRYLKTRKRKSWLCFDDDLLDILSEDAEEQLDGFLDKRDALRKCITKLSNEDTKLLRYRYEGEHSLAEISEVSGRTEGALKQVFLRLRRSLKSCIEKALANQPS